jgi:hypothetical protein
MPIEDVDYLKQHSKKESYIFLVDSGDRNRVSHPTPSEYVVEFTTPFQNVIGLEVLDASIPRTMYNIDVRNNSLSFLIHDPMLETSNVLDRSRYQTVSIDPGDYTIQTLLPALNGSLHMELNGVGRGGIDARIYAEPVTNPPEVQSVLKFRSAYPFAIDMEASTIAEALGFDVHVDPREAQRPSLQQRYTSFVDSNNYKLYHSVDLPPSVEGALGAETVVFDGPRGVVRRLPLSPTQRVAQQFRVDAPGYLTQVFVALTTGDGTIRTTSEVTWELYEDANDIPDTRIPLVNRDGGPMVGTIPISFTDGALSDVATMSFVSLEPGLYWIVLQSNEPDVYVYFNDVPTNRFQGECKTSTGINGDWQSVDTNEVHFEVSMRVILQDAYHYLTAPGIYNLVGERYVVLRCPEIEENSFRSLAYSKHTLGLAKFRLGVVGYSENRVDFKVPAREFHPIGKLPKMTLRFETAGGQLYDFKGVNHSITFAIHYYEPIQTEQFQQSILNPNYQGNVLAYMYHQDEQEQESDDQDYDYNRDDLREYRLNEGRHLPENARRWDLDALYHMRLPDSEDDAESP